MWNQTRWLPVAICVSSLIGCASFGNKDVSQACVRPQIERGERRPVIDGIGWVVGIPNKIILWDRRVENHNVSEQTEAVMAQYVNDLGLADTKVRLNQYAPIDEWRRLTQNKEVAWGWRYTMGVWFWVDEAVFPGRIFGGDHYNPYTNTISIYSDAPSIAVKEGSRARDIRSRRMPGTYATVNTLPLISMWHETIATGYAFDYLHTELPEAEQEGYHLLYPAYGAHLGSDLASFTPVPNLVGAAIGAIPGHLAGRYEGQEFATGTDAEPETTRAQSDD